jgi:UPF0755 protein
MKRMLRNVTMTSLALLVIVTIIAGSWLASFMSTAIAPAQETVVQIKSGTSFNRIAQQLARDGIIQDSRRFTLLARWQGSAAKIQAGEYLFQQAATPDVILERLVAGDVRKIRVTIPEGFNLQEIAARVEQTGFGPADEFMRLATDQSFINARGIKAETLEGYLFPETYTLGSGSSIEELLTAMTDQFRQQLTADILTAAEAEGLDQEQLVILASVIQKEAGNDEEMPLISAVFHNRLNNGIPLQADPTVIYGVKDFDGNLTRRHLNTPTPYNTYRKRGLPVGPISNPGLNALRAAAEPADVKYLYFVARGDGTHEFNTTLRAHNRAVRRYQLRR